MGTEGKMCDLIINWWSALVKDENYYDTDEYHRKLDAWFNGAKDNEIDHEAMYEEFCSEQFVLPL